MAYEGQLLAGWFDRSAERAVATHCHRMADRGGEVLTANVKRNTPIGHDAFDESYVPGKLRRSWTKKLVVVRPSAWGTEYESGTETWITYAPYVEHGTGLYGPRHSYYIIRPKKPGGWLSWIDQVSGERRFAKMVKHPGSPGSHMIAIGVSLTEHEFEEFSRGIVASCMRELEGGNHSKVAVRGRL